MTLKILQLNIYKGKYLNNVIDFIVKNDFDIVCLQEVASGVESYDSDNFEKLVENLGEYQAKLGISWKVNTDPKSYFGNAILYKDSLKAINYRNFFMKDYMELPQVDEKWEDRSRSCLLLDFDLGDKILTLATTHLAWGPTPEDKPYKIDQAKKLFDYIEKIKNPLVLTGDFNVTPQSEIVQLFSRILENQTVKYGLTNTLNLTNHKQANDLPRGGLAVDYIFNSKDINVTNFNLIETPELSDHLGLEASLEI